MKGGPVIFAIDNVSAELDSVGEQASQLAFPKKINFEYTF